jgi:DNA polymerase
MILVGDPEAQDGDMLLSGPHGQLVSALLAAARIAPENTYFASVLPRAMPHPDWAGIARDGFGNVLAHHVGLVRPKRILAFDGNNLPLTGNDWPNTPESLLRFNHEGQSIPLLVARGLAALLERARWKAGLWQGWLEWTRDL